MANTTLAQPSVTEALQRPTRKYPARGTYCTLAGAGSSLSARAAEHQPDPEPPGDLRQEASCACPWGCPSTQGLLEPGSTSFLLPSPQDALLRSVGAMAPQSRTPPLRPSCPHHCTALSSTVDTASSQPVFSSIKRALPPPQAASAPHHPPGRDEVQQPVSPDLLNATMRHGAHIRQVELLVPAEVILVSLAVWQWGAGDRTRMWSISHRGWGPQGSLSTHCTPTKPGPGPAWDTWLWQADRGVSAGGVFHPSCNKMTSHARHVMKSHVYGGRGLSEEREPIPSAPCPISTELSSKPDRGGRAHKVGGQVPLQVHSRWLGLPPGRVLVCSQEQCPEPHPSPESGLSRATARPGHHAKSGSGPRPPPPGAPLR